MHALHDLRPAWIRRTRAGLGLATGLAAIFAAGIVTTIALRPAKPPVIRVAAPAQPTVVPFAVPSVVVLPAPAPPPPPAPPEPELVVTPGPRALVPTINPACATQQGSDTTCTWDDGFPAISADGTLIATTHVPDDGGRGYPGLSIELIDVKTSRVVKSFLVLSPNEYLDSAEDPAWPKLHAKIRKRSATAQRMLDAKQFRALTHFATTDVGADVDPDGGSYLFAMDPALRGERSGDAVRVIDAAKNTVLWQHRFPIEAAYPAAKNPSPDGVGCYPSSTRGIGMAWDAPTRTMFTHVSYASGPCYCGDEVAFYVFRL